MITPFFAGLVWLNRGRGPSMGLTERTFAGRFGLNYAHDGDIEIACGGRAPLRVAGPVAWFTSSGHFVYGRPDGNSWNNRFLNFAGPRAEAFVHDGLLEVQQPVIPVRQPEVVRAAFDALYDQLEHGRADAAGLVHELEGLLLLLQRQRSEPALKSRLAAGISACCQRLRRAPAAVDVAVEAETLGVSAATFRRWFLRVTGMPPHRYVLQARMERAAVLLSTTTQPIKRIAEQVGMGDQYQFAKRFRRQYRMTPSLWRAEGGQS